MSAIRAAVPAAALLAVAACGGASDPEEQLTDLDGDGLEDGYEVSIGTNANDGDSDGDSWNDFDEVEGFSDPMDPDSHPYLGGWERRPVPEGLAEQETGTEEGDLAPDFALVDQFGELVSLWSFYGHVILLESGAFW